MSGLVSLLITILILAIVFILIVKYLLPQIPDPQIRTILLIVVLLIAILWLLNMAGVFSGGGLHLGHWCWMLGLPGSARAARTG